MAYSIENVTIDGKISNISSYKYALLYFISSLEFVETDSYEWDKLCMEDLLEARLFSEDEEQELHVFKVNDEFKAVVVKDQGNEDVHEVEYKLNGKFSEIGKYVKVKEYLSYDEDGQVVVKLTRLAGVTQEGKDGK